MMQELIRKYFNFYETKILPKIKTIPEVSQKDYWYHGLLTHTEWVVFRWIYFAVKMNKNPIPVIFACAGHDLARTSECDCFVHWPNAIPIIEKLMDMFDDILTNDEKERIKYAIKNHSVWTIAPDYISACLWDADRVRLSWEMWYNETFFNTKFWKMIASWDPIDFLDFENECLWRSKNTDNEWIIIHSRFNSEEISLDNYNQIFIQKYKSK